MSPGNDAIHLLLTLAAETTAYILAMLLIPGIVVFFYALNLSFQRLYILQKRSYAVVVYHTVLVKVLCIQPGERFQTHLITALQG